MSIPFARTALSCALVSCSFGALANDDVVTLGNTVVSASGFEQKITEAPASITVISGEELSQKRFNNLAQALEDVEGVDIRQGTGKTGGLNISMRGMPSDYTLILVDGRRQNNSSDITPNGFGDMNTSFLPPLSAIERIEVIRGPMSTLYGSDAMGGIVNIITKKVASEWGGSVTTDYTLQENRDYGDAQKTSIYASGPLIDNTLGLAVRGSYLNREKSNLQFSDGSTVSRRGASAVEGTTSEFGGRLTLTPNAQHDISLDVERGLQSYNNDECQLGNLDGFASGSATTGCSTPQARNASGYRDKIEYSRDQFALLHTGRFDLGTLDSNVTYSTTEQKGRTIPGTNAPNMSPGFPGRYTGGARELKTNDLVVDTKFVAPVGDSNVLTVGGQWWRSKVTDGIIGKELEQNTWAIFAENEWRMRDDLALTTGARYDNHETFGGHISPRVYLVWNTNDQWTMKGGVSTGYKTPSVKQLHDGFNDVSGQGATLVVGNPDLQPEKSISTEFGIYYDNYSDFNANATIFHTTFKDKIERDSDAAYNCFFPGDANNPAGSQVPNCVSYGSFFQQQYFGVEYNIGKATTQGLELASRWAFAPNWSISGNYTFTQSEQKSGDNKGARLTNTPKNMLNASLNWQATERLNLWFKGEYRSARERFLDRQINLTVANQALNRQKRELKAYEIFQLGGSYQATKNLTISANIYNLFDKDFLSGSYYTASNGRPTWVSDYAQISNSTTGSIEEGRRLWLSANLSF